MSHTHIHTRVAKWQQLSLKQSILVEEVKESLVSSCLVNPKDQVQPPKRKQRYPRTQLGLRAQKTIVMFFTLSCNFFAPVILVSLKKLLVCYDYTANLNKPGGFTELTIKKGKLFLPGVKRI